MPFGKYKGTPLEEVPAEYLLKLNDIGIKHYYLSIYVYQNLEELKRKAHNEKT